MINLKAPISTDIGYGVVAYNLLKCLTKVHGQQVTYFPIGQPRFFQDDTELIQRCIDNQNIFESDAPSITIWHEHQVPERIGRGKSILISFFELDTLNDRKIRNIETHDLFIASSEWMKDVIRKYSEIPIEVIPMGVDTDFFAPSFQQKPENEPFTFVNIGKLEVRKGHDILHELFNQAFTPQDNVRLLVSWNNPFMKPEEQQQWEKMYKETPMGERIEFVPRIADMRQLYQVADCCIFPTRAEAICLPILEAMSSFKPVITTNYSGPTAFCDNKNSYLVDIDQMEIAYDGVWFHGEGNWAKFGPKQMYQFVEHMKYIYANRININPAGRSTAERLDWKNVTKKLLEII